MQIGQTAFLSNASSTSAATIAGGDFQTFLKMLTVQMQNQDPLNPVDSSDYAVQLATFSGVEQAVRTNALLEGLQSQFGLMGMAQLAAWVGQEARVQAPVYFQGAPVTITANVPASADRAILVVQDANNQVVAREEVPARAVGILWHGHDLTGQSLPTGNYSLSIESYFGDQLLSALPVEHYAQIVEARGGGGSTRLLLAGGYEVDATAVTALRVPQ